jgi:uncharacterized membrane protein
MGKGRLEAFSDGVIAIIITIMVLELEAPDGGGFEALAPLLHVFACYALSFAYVGIYWNNHHHLLQATRKVSGRVLWANLHFLFWLSLFPFTTDWMAESHFAPKPTATYGVVLFMAAITYRLLQDAIVKCDGPSSLVARTAGADWKRRISPALYLGAIASSFVLEWVALGLYVAVALIWLVPDPRIEAALQEQPAE